MAVRPHTAHAEQGVTLLELITVLVIVGFLLTFSMIGLFSWIGEDHVRTTNQALQSAIQTAMAQALQGSQGYAQSDWSVVYAPASAGTSAPRIEVCPGNASSCTQPFMSWPVPATSQITLNNVTFSCLAITDHGTPDSGGSCGQVASGGHWTFAISDANHAHANYIL